MVWRRSVREMSRYAGRRVRVRARAETKARIPMPPNPPKKAFPMSFHGRRWEDSYQWMRELDDKVAMRHMAMYMEQEDKYTEAVMSDTCKLQHRLHFEMASRMYNDLCSPPIRWGPWLYYKRVAEGKAYPLLCRRLASANQEFSWNNTAASGFDFKTGQKIEQKLLDFNEVAEQSGGYAYEEMCEISPDHRFVAYAIYVVDKGFFTLCVKDLKTASLHHKPKVDSIDTLSWSKDGRTLFYTVTNNLRRPYQVFCSMLETTEPDTLLMEELDDSRYLTIRGTKDYQFITINCSSSKLSQVYLLDTTDLGTGLYKVWECESDVHSLLEHHHGYLYMFTDAPRDGNPVDGHYLLRRHTGASNLDDWENVFIDEPDMKIEDVDFFDKHMVLTLRKGRIPAVCSLDLPLPLDLMGGIYLRDLGPCFLPVPKYVCQISAGRSYDFYSSVVQLVISSPVMPDAVVDYNLLSREWVIIQQQDLRLESTQVLYVVYSREKKKHGQNPGLLLGHGAYGKVLDKRWRSDLKSLLDRGWVIAFADV
ncbi:hypothetical protein KI387_026883, partial [Taxus chinensis]